MENIAAVVEDGLCTGCGTCAGICPTEAIEMRISNRLWLPRIEGEKCTNCGLCVASCSGYSMNFSQLNSGIFGRQPEDSFLGNYRECYVAHSNHEEIRYNSSSGGVVTQLLVFALERGIIDGALVVRMREDRPLEPEPFIARTKEQILSASRSKYCPVATNEALRHVLRENGRFAVVGLPCHIHGVRKAEMNVKELSEKIVFHIGLMCSHTVNFFGTELILRKLGVSQDQVAKIDYRGLGWPGSMHIGLKDSSDFLIPYVGGWNAYWPIFSSFFFTPMRCLMCPDETNELADISVGDAWLPELESERIGESVVVVRTRKGEEILSHASSSGALFLKAIECEKVKRSQAEPLMVKKDDFGSRLAMIEFGGMKIPDFNPRQASTRSLASILRTLFAFSNTKASKSKIVRALLIYIPLPIFRLYCGAHKFLLSL